VAGFENVGGLIWNPLDGNRKPVLDLEDRKLEWRRAMQRRRFNQADSLEDRLAKEAKRLREKAKSLRPGPARDDLIRKAEQAETGAHISEWLRSPGVRPPQ
jgi:hypothetical protein